MSSVWGRYSSSSSREESFVHNSLPLAHVPPLASSFCWAPLLHPISESSVVRILCALETVAEEAAAAETQSGAALEMGSSPRTKQLGHVMKIIMTLLASPTFPKSWMGGAMTNRLTDRMRVRWWPLYSLEGDLVLRWEVHKEKFLMFWDRCEDNLEVMFLCGFFAHLRKGLTKINPSRPPQGYSIPNYLLLKLETIICNSFFVLAPFKVHFPVPPLAASASETKDVGWSASSTQKWMFLVLRATKQLYPSIHHQLLHRQTFILKQRRRRR